jgi:hypothetical protein
MKILVARSLVLIALALFGLNGRAQAQDNNRPMANERQDRLERLERRINELAERQEQLMRRAGGQMERQDLGGQMPGRRMQAMPRPGAESPMPLHDDAHMKKLHDFLGLLFLIGFICNILLAIWIYTDIRKRGEGSGIFVAMALIAGIPAAIIYALTRIGDKKA